MWRPGGPRRCGRCGSATIGRERLTPCRGGRCGTCRIWWSCCNPASPCEPDVHGDGVSEHAKECHETVCRCLCHLLRSGGLCVGRFSAGHRPATRVISAEAC